jgi:hypothetical protein
MGFDYSVGRKCVCILISLVGPEDRRVMECNSKVFAMIAMDSKESFMTMHIAVSRLGRVGNIENEIRSVEIYR